MSNQTQRTLWSEIVRAGDSSLSRSQEAREWLCRTYWGPIYVYLGRLGYDHEKRRDITQEFFLYFMEKNLAAVANPAKGRFRNFVIAILKRFLSGQIKREQAVKRGGKAILCSLDVSWDEGRNWLDPATEESPEREYDRRWALTVLDETMARLAEEYQRARRQADYEALHGSLTDGIDYAGAARLLNKTEGACRVEVHRLKKRYQHLIREVIGETLLDPEQVEDELNHLKAALRGE